MTAIIEFEKKDWEYPDLEKVANDMAHFIHHHKSLLRDLNTFMRNSALWWKRGDVNAEFQKWTSQYIPNRKKAAPDQLHFVDLLNEIKGVCETSDMWDKMRGLIPEKIFEIYFLRKHEAAVVEFGAQVIVYGKPVIYRAETTKDGDGDRRTVDAGSWDGNYGEFVEVKFQPDSFKVSEFGYLNLLEQELKGHQISHGIFLVTFDEKPDFVKRMLVGKGLLSDESDFKVLGRADFVG